MKTVTVKQPASNLKTIKPGKNDIKLDLDKILAQVWNQGLPNGILNAN